MNSLILWKDIIFNPVEGFKKVKPETKIALPLLLLLLLMALSVLLITPIMQSQVYSKAIVNTQITAMAEKGQSLSQEQTEAMREQLTSPTVRTITIVSALVGGVVTFLLMLLVSSLIMFLMARIFRSGLSFKLAFRILIFAGIITVIQALVKNGATLLGNYERALLQVDTTRELGYALTTPVSLAALFSPETLDITFYYLLDSMTDIFTWIYFIFVFFGLRQAAGIEKSGALKITLITALLYVLVGLVPTLLL
jgi:hypothetical protein